LNQHQLGWKTAVKDWINQGWINQGRIKKGRIKGETIEWRR